MFNFEKLEVWHRAIEFADLVYQVTRGFPADERFGLTTVSQSVLAMRQGFLPEELQQQIYSEAEELSRLLSGLKRPLLPE